MTGLELLVAAVLVVYLYGLAISALMHTRSLRALADAPPLELCGDCQNSRRQLLAIQESAPARRALALSTLMEAMSWPWTWSLMLAESLRTRPDNGTTAAGDPCLCGRPRP